MKEVKKMKRNFLARAIRPVEKEHWERIKAVVPPETIIREPKMPCTIGRLERSVNEEGWKSLAGNLGSKLIAEYALRIALLRRSIQYMVKRGGAYDNFTLATLDEIKVLEAELRRETIRTILEERKAGERTDAKNLEAEIIPPIRCAWAWVSFCVRSMDRSMEYVDLDADIRKALMGAEGVLKVNVVNFATGEIGIEHDANVLSVKEIKDAIRKAGYEVLGG
ncbi:MAG: heavy metal-associated domain-containing protein [Candidatus Micrarchaeota archaeon]